MWRFGVGGKMETHCRFKLKLNAINNIEKKNAKKFPVTNYMDLFYVAIAIVLCGNDHTQIRSM